MALGCEGVAQMLIAREQIVGLLLASGSDMFPHPNDVRYSI